jgi:hypothetical protein
MSASLGQWQRSLSRLPDNDKNRTITLDFFRCVLDTIEPGGEFAIKLLVGSTLDYVPPLLMSYVPRKSEDSLSHQHHFANCSSNGRVPNGLGNSLKVHA